MKKLPDELTITEIARLLCGKQRKGSASSADEKMMLKFLLKAARPFSPKKISTRHDLIAFYKDDSDRENGNNITIAKDYFIHFIHETPSYRYPRIKEHYRKNSFWRGL